MISWNLHIFGPFEVCQNRSRIYVTHSLETLENGSILLSSDANQFTSVLYERRHLLCAAIFTKSADRWWWAIVLIRPTRRKLTNVKNSTMWALSDDRGAITSTLHVVARIGRLSLRTWNQPASLKLSPSLRKSPSSQEIILNSSEDCSSIDIYQQHSSNWFWSHVPYFGKCLRDELSTRWGFNVLE